MVSVSDIIRLQITEDDIKESLFKAIERIKISKRDNLRNRKPAVQLDCLFRGYLGERCICQWLNNNDISIFDTNIINDDDNMDVDLSINTQKGQIINAEIKTSNIPECYINLKGVINKADIKILKRSAKVEELEGDVHIQIYYNIYRKKRDNYLNNIDVTDYDVNQLYSQLNMEIYLNRSYFVAWIDKPTLVKFINQLPYNQRTWHYSKKDYWVCKLNDIAKAPILLLDYLKS